MDYFPPQNRQSAYEKLKASLILRVGKLGIPISAKPDAPKEPAPVPVWEMPSNQTEPVSVAPAFPDLYIPPEYSGAPFAPPPAKVQTWTFGGIEFVKVPHGEFLMGSTDKDKNASEWEKPQHKINIPYDFLIGRFPVTNEQFSPFAKEVKLGQWGNDPQSKPTHPVVNVSWKTAVAFCDWMNQKYKREIPSSLVFRLPAEAEWEKAARGGDGRIYPWGNDFDSSHCNSSESGRGTTAPVGAFSLQGDSPYGVCDMSGNVWEWTASLWGKDFQKPDYKYPYNPRDGRENQKVGDEYYRVIRGGSFVIGARFVRAALRFRDHYLLDGFGFRVALAPILS